VDVAASGMMQLLTGEFVADSFGAAVEILGRVNVDAEELRSAMPEALRESLRDYIKNGISKLLTDNLFDDSTRSHAAIALGRIGDPEDLADLRRLIEADILRHNTQPRGTNYSNWFVRALLWLDASGVDTTLIQLLREQRYEGEAARGLVQLAVPPIRQNTWPGHTTDYDAIWAAREGALPRGFDAGRAKRYAVAIKERISELKEESEGSVNAQYYASRMKDLAVLLAVLDGRDLADFIIETLARPSQWDAYHRMKGIRTLLMSGAILRLDSMLTVIDPAIEHVFSQGIYNDQNSALLFHCLDMLRFSDDPARAIARIEELIARFQYPPYQLRDLVTAMGHTRSEAAVPFLLNVARDAGGLQNMQDAWIARWRSSICPVHERHC
jgi:hypothetical protein